LTSIIISKPNKTLYDNSKIFWLIVLLNTVGKLIKKVISSRLQVYSTALNFIYLNQIGDIKQQSTTNTGIYLTYCHKLYSACISTTSRQVFTN